MTEFDLYRRILASADPVDTCIWYLGQMFLCPEDYPPIQLLQVEAVMFYRAETISEDSYRIRWTEIGAFRDAVTGEKAGAWRNPVTGETTQLPSGFTDGPGDYIVDRDGDGIRVTLNQPNAIVDRVEHPLTRKNGRLLLDQNEFKKRTLLQSGTMAETHTRLFIGVDETDGPTFCGDGAYRTVTQGVTALGGFSEHAGRTITQGPMRITTPADCFNAGALSRLRAQYPIWFDADGLKPRWND